MIRIKMAFPAVVLLLALSIPSTGQTFVETPGAPVAPRVAQSPSQSPAESSVIVVKPELTDEQLADLYMARKDFREAAFSYKRLTDQHPQNPVYLNKLGIALHQQAALGAALKYYERASKVDPSYADAQNNIGTIWYQRKKYGRAIKAYQKAINIRNDMAVLHSNLGYAYFGDKKYVQAISSFRQALALDPQLFEHSNSRNGSILQDRSVGDRGRFYFLLAKSFAEAGNLERCLIYLRKAKDEGYKELSAVKTDPSFAAALKDPAIQEVLAPKPPDSTQP
ncbi:MAG TPA: tetratricopeptide repeat protein [Candidatus Acidoferrales bacterium]|jgi:tetratricopeptide (TPR) repeat protein|nr:tetratricopeptide repeat protein [Candidatus Acidoferrales bacterium]